MALRVTDGSSTLQTELAAIRHALQDAITRTEEKVLIHTDSLSSILSLQKPTITDNYTLIADIHQIIETINKSVTINWVPSHLGDGIPGNEIADALAKQGTTKDTVDLCIPASKQQIKRSAKSILHTRWRNQIEGQLIQKKSTSLDWCYHLEPSSPRLLALPRKYQIPISRLRLGVKTYNQIKGDNTCPHCDQNIDLPPVHILAQCDANTPYRHKLTSPLSPEQISPDPTVLARNIINHQNAVGYCDLIQFLHKYKPL